MAVASRQSPVKGSCFEIQTQPREAQALLQFRAGARGGLRSPPVALRVLLGALGLGRAIFAPSFRPFFGTGRSRALEMLSQMLPTSV